MLSLRAKTTKKLIRSLSSKSYDASRIDRIRRNFDRNLALMFPSTPHHVYHQKIADHTVEVIKSGVRTDRVIVYLHGGGFIVGSPRSYRQHLKRLASLCSATVFAIEYSLAPEAQYPQALDEIQSVWETLIADGLVAPDHVVFMGDSAGGNLALASLIRFRDRKLPMPSCLVLLSPLLDATFSGTSHQTKSNVDSMLNSTKLELFVNSYVGKTSRNDPIVSPIFADLQGLPPMLIHVGSDELLLSDSQTITDHAKRDNVDASLFVGQGLWHGWHFFASYVPEAKQAMRDIAKFVKQHS